MFIKKEDYYNLKERIKFLEDLFFNDFIEKRIKDLENFYEIKIKKEIFRNNVYLIYYENDYPDVYFSLYGPNFKNKKDELLYVLGPIEDDLKSKLYEKRINK